MDLDKTIASGFSASFARKLKDGFPLDWKELLHSRVIVGRCTGFSLLVEGF